MNIKSKLEDLTNACRAEMINLLWSRVEDLERHLNDISDLLHSKNAGLLVTTYIKNIRKTDYRQYVSVENKYIDVFLQRYMLEAALNRITVDVDADPLANISLETSLRAIMYLENCFDIILTHPPGVNILLFIKRTSVSIEITASNGKTSIFFNPESQ